MGQIDVWIYTSNHMTQNKAINTETPSTNSTTNTMSSEVQNEMDNAANSSSQHRKIV